MIATRRPLLPVFAATLLAAAALPAQDHAHHGTPAGELGRVDFPVSCTPEAQQRFGHAMALLHSFWWDAAASAFDSVAAADPSCAMAHWGRAMTAIGNPFAGPPSAEGLRTGYRALQQAQALPLRTARERDHVGALATLFRDHDRLDHRTRATAYEAAMAELAKRHPRDAEAAIFHARAIVANTPTTDKSFTRQRRAGAMLQRLFDRSPDHPGLAHYLIHTYDAPPIAHLGADAARRYSRIAPAAPHAQHMPSHIFTRLGDWDESIETNLASAAAARKHEEAQGAKGASFDRLHAWDYLVYAYLQRGHDEKAQALLREAAATEAASNVASDYSLAAIPARFALERGRWADAAKLQARPSATLRAAEGIGHFARGIGAARGRDLAAARDAVQKLEALHADLERQKIADWAERVAAQRLAVAAWIAHAEGNAAEAVRLATEAAEREETVDKHPVTPGPILPARELLGDLLMEMDRPAEALAAYEASLKLEPNRARSLYGAGLAAERAGRRAIARKRYAEYVQLMDGAAPGRDELEGARRYLAAR